MSELFPSGHIVDLILIFMLIETAVLAAYAQRTGRGVAPFALASNMLAGCALLLALRGALVGAPWAWTAACLVAALVAHLADLRYRWRR